MRFTVFAGRNLKEIIRDPMSVVMCLGFPVTLIIILSMMKRNIGEMANIFEIQNFAPSMMIFGLSFLGMFVGTLMSSDKNSSFLTRLFASPLTGFDYIMGYSLPILPLAVLQSLCCFLTAFLFGLQVNLRVLVAFAVLLPVAVLFIGFGLFMGSVLSSHNQVSGFGTILVNGTVFLSGAVIPLDLVGNGFKNVCYLLPFAHANDAVKSAITGDYGSILPHCLWVLGYALLLIIPSVWIFRKRMKE